MKRLNEYTTKELYNLTDAEIKDLVDLECAYAGVSLLPPRPQEPSKPSSVPDMEGFEVGGITFALKQDADDIAEFLNSRNRIETSYDSDVGYDYKFVRKPPITTYEVSKRRMFSRDAFEAVKSDLVKYRAAKEDYDKRLKEYDGILSERQDVFSDVSDAYQKARREIWKLQENKAKYQRYLELANGDAGIALKFLVDALHITVEEAQPIIDYED